MADKVDYKTTLRIEGDTRSAEAGIRRVSTRLQNLTNVAAEVNRQLRSDRINSVLSGAASRMDRLVRAANNSRNAILAGMRSVAIFGLAVEGIRRLVELWQTANRLIEQFRTRLERAALASHVERAASETRRLVSAQGELNRQLKEQLDLLQRASTLREMRQSGFVAFEDQARDQARAVERAGVSDPRQLRALEDRYAAEDEARARARRSAGTAAQIDRLQAEADRYGAAAQGAGARRGQLVRQLGDEDGILQRQYALKASDEEIAATRKRLEALGEALKAAVEEQRTFELEAGYRRSQIAILKEQQRQFDALAQAGSPVQAAARLAWDRIDRADAEANARLAERLEANEASDRWERDFARATPAEKIEMLRTRENDARTRLGSLQDALAQEMGKEVAQRDEGRLGELRSGIERAQGEMFSARRQREAAEDAAAAASTGERAWNVQVGGGSRLNAMGLGAGSGVQRVQEQMAKSLADLVRLGRDQLTQLRGLRSDESAATFS